MKIKFIFFMLFLISIFLFEGCRTLQIQKEIRYMDKTVEAYEHAGNYWGEKHLNSGIRPNDIDELFVQALISGDKLDFFWVHSDLKEAFKKGYRIGYTERTSDLVLGPHLTEAAGQIGFNTALRFINVIEAFEEGWGKTLKKAIDVFIALISEGSQADREKFISRFSNEYRKKYNNTYQKLISGNLISVKSEGGTLLYIDGKKTFAILDIPSDVSLKSEIYHQTFRVMGDEWGRRLSHNLITRSQLIELLRRSRTALQEIPLELTKDDRLQQNLCLIYHSFVDSYGTDAGNVFKSIAFDAGFKNNLSLCHSLNKKQTTESFTKTVIISSNVRNDNVQVCEDYGSTRFNLNLIKGRNYQIKISKPGYQPMEKTLNYSDVNDGEIIRFFLSKEY